MAQKNNEASIKNLKTQIGYLSHQVAAALKEGLLEYTCDNPKNEKFITIKVEGKTSEVNGEIEEEN
jgi:hypothetical protein